MAGGQGTPPDTWWPTTKRRILKYGTVAYLVIQTIGSGARNTGRLTPQSFPPTVLNRYQKTLCRHSLWRRGIYRKFNDKSQQLFAWNSRRGINYDPQSLTMSSGLTGMKPIPPWISKPPGFTMVIGSDLIMDLKVVEEPESIPIKSGDTQLLICARSCFWIRCIKRRNKWGIFKTEVKVHSRWGISEYAERKLWKPLGACNDAFVEPGPGKTGMKNICCFIRRPGIWRGSDVWFWIKEIERLAADLRNLFEWSDNSSRISGKWVRDGSLDYYGFQIWIMHYKEMRFPAFRGLGGQYMFVIPQNAIVIRLGHKRSDEYIREKTIDMDAYLDIAFKILERGKKAPLAAFNGLYFPITRRTSDGDSSSYWLLSSLLQWRFHRRYSTGSGSIMSTITFISSSVPGLW